MTNHRPGAVLFLEDFEAGQSFDSQGRTVSEADVVAFAALTWDTNEVHTAAHGAAEGRFAERIGAERTDPAAGQGARLTSVRPVSPRGAPCAPLPARAA